jgi:hypothetical protein
MIGRGNPKNRRKICCTAISSTVNLARSHSGLNSGLCGGVPVSSSLRNDTTCWFISEVKILQIRSTIVIAGFHGSEDVNCGLLDVDAI